MCRENMSSAIRLAAIILALCALASPATAQTCSDTASANAGDEVTVFAILHTTDPNETGEGEPLTVTISNGGPTTTFPDYEVSHIIPSFKAISTGPVTAAGTIIGADGDESCEVIVSVNAKHWLAPEQKKALKDLVNVAAPFAAFNLTLGVLLCVPEPEFCDFFLETGADSAHIAKWANDLLKKDPIDLNFTVIPVPVSAPFTPITAGGHLTQAVADAMNALLRNEAKIIGLLRATDTSINRAAGAASVGNTFWEQKQVEAINGFMFQLGGLLTQEANARVALAALLTAEDFPVVNVSPQQVLAFEQRLAFQGWTADELAYLHQIGEDDAFIEAMRPLIFSRDINQVAGSFPAALANPTQISILRQAGRDLTPFVGMPGNANCHGASVSALAKKYGGTAKAATALGFKSVNDLENAVRGFCGN
ncbi:MAG: hypothetical protein V7609_1274 [Verrucomicrobiota bacterium]